MNVLNNIVRYMSGEVKNPLSMRVFGSLTYLWFIINTAMIWNVKEMLWGMDNVFFRQGHADGFLENFIYQLVYSIDHFHVIFYLHIICAFLSLPNKWWSFAPRLITWSSGLMLYYAAPQAFNSGMMVMLLMAFYNSVVYVKTKNTYRIVLNNAARIACIAQVILVYFVAGIYKISGEQWLAGDAIYYTLHIDYLSSPYWQNLTRSSFVMKALDYAALGYQLLFPILIWKKKGRVWVLLAGVIFHLFIGFALHLWDFALAMIFCYVLFMREELLGRMKVVYLRM